MPSRDKEPAREIVSAKKRTRSLSTVDDTLLGARLQLYIKVLFLIHAGFLLVDVVQRKLEMGLTGDPLFVPPYAIFSWVMTLALGCGWWYLANRQPPRWLLYGGDVAIPLALGESYYSLFYLKGEYSEGSDFIALSLDALLNPQGDYEENTGLILLSLEALVLVLRASLVPSSVRRTILVGSVAVSRTVIVTMLFTPDLPLMERLWLAALGVAFVIVTVVTSSVIYGLRREVRDARRLGQYTLKRKIGEGGMGSVFEATHVLLQRPTAVKLLPIDKAGEESVARFEREVRYTSRLEHPNCVAIYDYGRTPDGQFYYAMEYLAGYDLDVLVDRHGPMNDARTVSVLLQAAHALAEAHDANLVHRDVKPRNIRLCDRGGVPDMVKVLDFGLVKSLSPDGLEDSLPAMVTQAATLLGTPQYFAPETIRGDQQVGPPADVYALGAVGWFLLTGRQVFEGSSVVEVCARHLTEEPRKPSEVAGTEISPELEAVILRCLAKDPDDRYRNGRELSAALARLNLDGWSWKQARAWWDEHPSDQDGGDGVTLAGQSQLNIDVRARDGG